MKKFALLFVALVVAVMFIPQPVSAASKSMTTYNQVIKIDKTVYCTDGHGIFRVSLKSGKVKTLVSFVDEMDWRTIANMKSKGKYIYFVDYSDSIEANIMRVSKSKANARVLAQVEWLKGYAIYKNNIYYTSDEPGKMKMALNGKSKKKTKYRAIMKEKNTNKKGYSVLSYIDDEGYFVSFLKTPKGKEYLLERVVE